ncbi:MAG: gamma-glutamyl-gamma-aminobutyrate hydrolase family protein [Planctomyces sp.]|nr:gamma-glutamyl-gamma-aminobutyrate hydrolase family protein [Planctomyces sp.]
MSTRRPVIGITGDFRPERYDGAALSWFNTGYYDSIIAAGGMPVLLPPFDSEELIVRAMDMLDGIVLAGCNLDLDPSRMKMHPHPAVKIMPKRREDFDRRVTEIAIERRMPILAIGSGMQLVNVLCGGTLFQHIPEELPRALHHRDPVEKNLRHVLEIVPGTRVDMIYGPGEVRVNSNHHMAINDLSSRFRVSATCPDGVIEAYESVDDNWFCLGVQWHPESNTASALDLQIFEAFVESTVPQEAGVPLPVAAVSVATVSEETYEDGPQSESGDMPDVIPMSAYMPRAA